MLGSLRVHNSPLQNISPFRSSFGPFSLTVVQHLHNTQTQPHINFRWHAFSCPQNWESRQMYQMADVSAFVNVISRQKLLSAEDR